MIRRDQDRAASTDARTARPGSASGRPPAGLVRLARLGASVVALGAAFVLGAVLLHVAAGDERGPIELAAVPDVGAAQGTGEGFHEVAVRRVDALERPVAPDSTDAGTGADDGVGGGATPGPEGRSSSPSTLGRTGGPGGATTTVVPGPTGAPPITAPGSPLPTVTTPTATVPGVSLPPVSVPTVSLPPVTTPTVSVPPLTTPTVSVPTVSVPTVDPTLPPVTLPPVTLPPIRLPWFEGS